MLRCQRCAVVQPGAAGRSRATCLKSGSRRAGSTAAQRCPRLPGVVVCAAAPEGGGTPSSPRISSLEQSEQERLKNTMLKYAEDSSNGANSNGANGAASNGSGAGAPQAVAQQLGVGEAADPEPGSWEDWTRYFYAMDDIVHDLEALHADMDDAVAREDYKEAARIKAQRTALEEEDCVGAALDALDEAVEEERFEEAARLRDQAAVGIMGWWVGRGNDDSQGHLLRVSPDFGRYVGQVFTPRDVADMLALQPNSFLGDSRLQAAAAAQLLGGRGGEAVIQDDDDDGPPLKPEDLGLPVLELFLRRAPGSSEGSLQFEQQAVALYAPESALLDEEDKDQEEIASKIAEIISTSSSDSASVISIEQGQGEDGSTYVKIEIGGSVEDNGNSSSEEEEDDEDEDGADESINTVDDLAARLESLTPSGKQRREQQRRGQQQGEDDDEEEDSDDDESEATSSSGKGSGSGSSSLQDEVDAVTEALLQSAGYGSGGELSSQRWQLDGSDDVDDSDDEDDEDAELIAEALSSASQLPSMLQRAPAQIEWEGRDRFSVTVQEPPALVAGRQQAAAAAAAAEQARREQEEEEALQLKRPPVRIIYDGKEQQRQRQQQQQPGQEPEDGSSSSSSGSDASASSSSSTRNADGSIDVGVAFDESDSEDVAVRLSGQQAAQQGAAAADSQQRQQQQEREEAEEADSLEAEAMQQRKDELEKAGEGDQWRQQDSVAEDSAALAEQIEALKGEFEAGRRPSKEQLNEIARRAMGLAIAQGIASANSAPERWGLEGRTTYERLQLGSMQKTDPFSGLYVGTFGPHGPELLHVSRQREGGKEFAVATKLTGDPNVPAGSVSWKAQVDRGSRLPVEMYPPEMAVNARYKGQGQVAQQGFVNPKWVDGELLVFGANSPFVRGAQLGFTFDVRANQRYLIVLHRVNLDELFPEDDE